MESNLKFEKTGEGKYTLTDVSLYDKEGISGLLNTFNASVEMLQQRKLQYTSTLKQLEEELELMQSRYEQVKAFAVSEGLISLDLEVEKERENS